MKILIRLVLGGILLCSTTFLFAKDNVQTVSLSIKRVQNYILAHGPKKLEVIGLDNKTEYKFQIKVGSAIAPFSSQALPAAKNLTKTSAHPLGEYDLKKGGKITVTVSKKQKDGSFSQIAEFVLESPSGAWQTGVGFMFIPNEDRNYFFSQQGENQFAVTEEANRDGFDFAPSVFWTWIPADQQGNSLMFGGTVGLGATSSAPTVFAGLSATYNRNLSFVAGVVMHQQKRLRGRFSEGQVVSDNMADLTESVYKANVFIGLSLVFDAIPSFAFGGGS